MAIISGHLSQLIDGRGVQTRYEYDASEAIRTYTERGQWATLASGSTTIDTRSYDDGGRMTASSESRVYNTDNTLASKGDGRKLQESKGNRGTTCMYCTVYRNGPLL